MPFLPHLDPASLYFLTAATYVVAALMAMHNWHRPLCGCYGLIAVLHCLFGLSHLAH